MAVTIGSRAIIMTAAGDTINRPLKCLGVRLVGTTMTTGQRLVIKDRGSASGKVIADHYVQQANEDAMVFEGQREGQWMDRPYLDTVPAAGTWTVIFQIT